MTEDPHTISNSQMTSSAGTLPSLGSGAVRAVRYRLIEGSTLVDDCTICGRPTILIPIRGSFWLVPTGQDMWFSYFAIRGLWFKSVYPVMEYKGQMEGTYKIGGDFALVHQMTFKGFINQFEDLKFDSGVVFPKMGFPWIEIDLLQVPPTDPLHTFGMHLVAVPWPDVWFSTEEGFTSSVQDISKISDGDILSPTGRLIRSNNQLTVNLGIMPIVPDIGLDAILGLVPQSTELPRPCCEIWFSAEQDIHSETLGQLHHGDLLSNGGRIVRSYIDFIGAFSPMPPIPDAGLDAIALDANRHLLFSVEEDFFSEKLGRTINHGDLLSEDGRIFKTISDLLANFQPIEPRPISFGLDAAYVWPHGEVWFSIEVDFADLHLGTIGHGDLLSDRGRVIARNQELVESFGPIEDLADFGLDGLQVLWPFLPPDFDFDGDVDFVDFALFAAYWQETGYTICSRADLNCDGKMDFLDVQEFGVNWLICK
ncbi:MAG: hypothetical protein ACYSUY_05210 [Planctomycetota bacterium]